MPTVPSLRRVGFNALFLDPGVSGGSETYLRQLVPAIAAAAPELELEIATTRRGADALVREGWTDLARIVAMPADVGGRLARGLAEQLRLPALARRREWDVLHNLASIAPLAPRVPTVTTLLDLLFLKQQTLSRFSTFAMKWTTIPPARRAEALIAISATARDEMCEIAGFRPQEFTVIPLGAGRLADAVTPTPEAQLRERYELGARRVVLSVGAMRPHKNQELLVRAAAQLPDDVVVVLAGHPEGYEERLRALIAELGVEARVRLADYVPDEDLEGLWRLAACGAFPTLAEGFGLPLLEALDRGVATAASDIPVLHEVGGDVPHWFDPRDPASAVAAIEAAITDESAAAAGRAQAERFSWAANARATLAVYERAAGVAPASGRAAR